MSKRHRGYKKVDTKTIMKEVAENCDGKLKCRHCRGGSVQDFRQSEVGPHRYGCYGPDKANAMGALIDDTPANRQALCNLAAKLDRQRADLMSDLSPEHILETLATLEPPDDADDRPV